MAEWHRGVPRPGRHPLRKPVYPTHQLSRYHPELMKWLVPTYGLCSGYSIVNVVGSSESSVRHLADVNDTAEGLVKDI